MKTQIATTIIILGFSLIAPSYASEVTGALCTGLNCSIDATVIVAPVASPAAGTYTSAQSVTLTATGATSIRYTTDGSTIPTCSTGTLYSGAISVSTTTTIKAISCYPNSASSSVVSYLYTITPVCTPASVSNGSVNATTCAITCNTGYTLSGNTCNVTSSGGGGGGGGSSVTPTPKPKPPVVTPPIMPPVTPPVTPTVPPITPPTFSDIANSFARDDIQSFATRGFLKGYSDGTFQPESPITRAEFLAVTMKALGITGDATETTFQDIPTGGKWMIPYVEKARALGIAHGQTIEGKLSFRPNDSITRAEALAMLLNAAKISVDTSLKTTQFADVTMYWMMPYVEKAKALGIANGQMINGVLKFRPNDSITRAESVKIITKASSL